MKTARCKPCEGGSNPLSQQRIHRLLEQLPEWKLSEDGTYIRRIFSFRGFARTMNFVNALAWLSLRQGHHPDFRVGFDYCDVSYTTHAVGGLSENDFICAARLDAIYGEGPHE